MFEILKVCIDDNMVVLLIVFLYLLQSIFTFAIKNHNKCFRKYDICIFKLHKHYFHELKA